MKTLVAGAGAVGSWLGAALAAGGSEVTLVTRGAHFEAVSKGGLRRSVEGVIQRFDVAAFDSIARAAAAGPFDVTLVTVKSYQTAALAGEIVSAGMEGPLVSFQNGVGNEAILSAIVEGREIPTGVALARVPRSSDPDSGTGPEASLRPEAGSSPGQGASSPVFAGTLTSAVQLIEPGLVELRGTSKGGVGLGSPGHPVSDRIASSLDAGGITVQRYSDLDAMKWSKLLLNMLGAASCAILRRPPDEILARGDIFSIEHRAWKEAIRVMRKLGLPAIALPGYPVDKYAAAAAVLPSPLLGAIFGRRLARARGSRLPGTAADLIAGRKDSEIHAMHGVIAEVGAACGIATPVCAALRDLVDGIAAGRLPAERFIGRPHALAEAVQQLSKATEPLIP